jgi:Zn-dependent protease with chaperone function
MKKYIGIASLGLGMVFAEKIPALSELAQLGVGMLFLRFSRDNERQADDLGVEYSSAGQLETQKYTVACANSQREGGCGHSFFPDNQIVSASVP